MWATDDVKATDGSIHRFYPRRPNVFLGTTVENQEQADKRIPELMKCRDLSPVLFLSCEPLLEPIDFFRGASDWGNLTEINWVIVGGESGPNYRYMSPHWVQSLHDQCKSAGIPFFCKQGSGQKSGRQYDLPDHLFSVKEFPCPS
jgi:protein gp37